MYEDRLNGILPEFMFTEKTEPILKKIQDVHIEIDNLRNEIKSSTKDLLKTNTHRQYKDYIKKD